MDFNAFENFLYKTLISNSNLSKPFYVYPTIPPYYTFSYEENKKPILTYGLLFIYPSYSNLIAEIEEDYSKIFQFFEEKVKEKIIRSPEIDQIEKEEHYKMITRNIIRGFFIHENERKTIINGLNINPKNEEIMQFYDKLREFTEKLREKDIKPIAIIAIAIPNGVLKDKYLDKFVSGKKYGESARYHYENGVFEIIKEKTNKEIPRVLFLDINENYLEELKQYFTKIILLDYQLKEI